MTCFIFLPQSLHVSYSGRSSIVQSSYSYSNRQRQKQPAA